MYAFKTDEQKKIYTIQTYVHIYISDFLAPTCIAIGRIGYYLLCFNHPPYALEDIDTDPISNQAMNSTTVLQTSRYCSAIFTSRFLNTQSISVHMYVGLIHFFLLN